MKRLFLNRVKSRRIINSAKRDKLINGEEEIAKIFNEYVLNTVQKLSIVIEQSNTKLAELHLDEIYIANTKYKNHACLETVKNRMVKTD